jgi:peptidoglycan hydrolase-like protein with peptidoglycan-binding domain
LGLAAFAVLTGALVINLLVLQPPGRGLGTSPEARINELNGTAMKTASAAPAPTAGRPGEVMADQDGSSELTRAIQRELAAKGYETGAVDGIASPVTQAAIMAYEADNGLALTGEPRQGLLQHIVLGATGDLPGAGRDSSPAPSTSEGGLGTAAERIIRSVQASLRRLGYAASSEDGRMSPNTILAIRKFEADQRMPATGRVSGELMAKLAALAGRSSSR